MTDQIPQVSAAGAGFARRGGLPDARLNRRQLVLASAAAAGGMVSSPAFAKAFPAKMVRIVVPFAPGGATDVAARMVAVKLSELWGQPVVVDNVTGASGILGAQNVQRQPPDGYTLMVTVANTQAIMPHIQRMPFEPLRDFSSVTLLARAQSGLMVRGDMPVKTLADLFAYARALKAPLPIGDWGQGSSGHLLAAGLAVDERFEVTHIHYRGVAPALQAVLAREISVSAADVASVFPHLRAGTVRFLGLNGMARHPELQDTPTFNESGIPDHDNYAWVGVFAPAKTPLALRESIAAAFQQVCLAPEMQPHFLERGFITAHSGPAAFEAEWRETYERFGKLAKKTGVKADV